MTKDPSTLGRGLMFGIAWLIWLLGGYAYLRMHGAALGDFSAPDKIVLSAWTLVSTGLLFYAIALALRGLGVKPGRSDA